MQTQFRLDELNSAIDAEHAAKAEAMRKGLSATKPLTVLRLAELCVLGEKMTSARIRKEDAYTAALAWIRREKLDIVLPVN